MAPISVAITASGRGNVSGEYMNWRISKKTSEVWTHVPLYKILKDPLRREQVFRGADCNEPTTIIAIFQQQNYPLVCIDFCKKFIDGQITALVDAACVSGYHRCSTFSGTVACMLNRLVDSNGDRRFNVQVFNLYPLTKWTAIHTHANSAVDFMHEAWRLMPGGKDVPRDQLFAFAHVATRPRASRHWEMLFDWCDYLIWSMWRCFRCLVIF